MNGGRRLDLHVHSRHSPDGASSVGELVTAAIRAGMDGLALTDHNSIAGHAELAEAARANPDLRLIPGVEVSTLGGHLLVYGVRELPPIGQPIATSVEWAVSHGGVPVLAHPYRRVHGAGPHVGAATRLPAVEVVNGHTGRRANRWARELAAGRGAGATGGSDAHRPREVGRAWTLFPPGADSPEELLSALAAGGTTAGGAPLPWAARAWVSARSFVLRLGRGGRPV